MQIATEQPHVETLVSRYCSFCLSCFVLGFFIEVQLMCSALVSGVRHGGSLVHAYIRFHFSL